MNLKDPIYWLIILFLLALAGWQWNSAKFQKLERFAENSRFQDAVDKHRQTAQTARARADSVEAKRIRDSLFYKSRLMASGEEIKAYRKTIEKLRPLVQAKIDSFPDLRDFVAAQDSTIDSQADIIRDQEIFCIAQVRDLKEIIALTNQQLEAQKEITNTVTEQLATVDKRARKERRGKNFFKVVSAVLAGGILYMAVKE